MSITQLVSMVPDWLAVTAGREVSVGLSSEDALQRASILRGLLGEGKLDPAHVVLDEDLKVVFQALVTLVIGSEPRPGQQLVQEADAVYQFIRRVDWPDDDFGEKQDLLIRCATAGWAAVGLDAVAVAKRRTSIMYNVDTTPGSLRFPPRQADRRLSPDEVSAVATRYLDTPIEDRGEELTETALNDADIVLSIYGTLKEQRDADPSSVAREASFIYGRIAKKGGTVGLFDERDYFLGEFAYLAGGASRFLGRRQEAFRWLDRAEAAFRHTVNPGPGLANVAYTRLVLRIEQGRYEDVLELLPSLVASFRRLGMDAEVFKCLMMQAEALRNCDQLGEARALLQDVCTWGSEKVEAGLLGQALVRLGECEALEGRFDVALSTYRKALPLLQQANRTIALAHLRSVVAETLRVQGQLAEALDGYKAAQRDYAGLAMPTWVANMSVMIADVLLALGRPREAEWEILQALPTIEEQKMAPEGFAAVALLRESVKRRKADPNALRELREHLQKQN